MTMPMDSRSVWSRVFITLAVVASAGCGGGDPSEEPPPEAGRAVAAHAPNASVSVVAMVPVERTVGSSDVVTTVYRIVVANTGRTSQPGLMATIVGAPEEVTVVEGSVLVGNVDPRSVAKPADTVTLRHPKKRPLLPFAVRWALTLPINGQPVPPSPDPVANAATVAGIDTNSNGVRDDIDIRLAEQFGGDGTAYGISIQHARSVQSAMVAPSEASALAYGDAIRCAPASLRPGLARMTRATLDSALRRQAYALALSGMEFDVSQEGCP